MEAINCCSSMPNFLTDGRTKKVGNGNYIKYLPVSEIGEIRDTVVNGGRSRDVYNKNGEFVFSIGQEAGLFTAEQVIGKELNLEA